MRIDHCCALIALALALMLPGCGPGRGDVSGIVNYRSKPLPGGTITFYDEHNGAISSEIKMDGSYAVTNVGAGVAKIAVVTPMAISMPGMKEAKSVSIPPKYADREKSGLTCQVKTGSQTHQVDLE